MIQTALLFLIINLYIICIIFLKDADDELFKLNSICSNQLNFNFLFQTFLVLYTVFIARISPLLAFKAV